MTKLCEFCSADITGSHGSRKFCDDRCRNNHYYKEIRSLLRVRKRPLDIEYNPKYFRQYITEDKVKTDIYVSKVGTVLFLREGKYICLIPRVDKGYLYVRDRGNFIKYSVHRLVYSCWVDDTLTRSHAVTHIDKDKLNNHMDNLKVKEFGYSEFVYTFRQYAHWGV